MFDSLHQVGDCTGEAVALAAFLPWGFASGDDLDRDCPAAVADPFDAHLADTRVLGVKEVGCLEPCRIGDV